MLMIFRVLFQNGRTDSTYSGGTQVKLNTEKFVQINIVLDSLPKYYLILGIRTMV